MKTRLLAPLSLLMVLLTLPMTGSLAQESDDPAWLQMRDVAHGTVQTLEYRSESLDRDREAIVYLPPGYDGSTDRLPVLYLLHGAGSDQRSWIDSGHANVILDNLMADGRLDPLIVVMPFGYATPREPAAEGAGRGGRRGRGRGGFGPEDYKDEMIGFTEDFMNDLVPFVESRYRVVADRDHRAIAGLSMGGGQSFAIGLTHPEMFSTVAGFSSAMQIANNPDWGGIDMEATLAANVDSINEFDMLWVGCGTEDTLFNANSAFADQLAAAGIEHTFRVTLGAHTMEVWQRYLHEVAPLLFAMN